MCGRFTLTSSGSELARAFELAEEPELSPRYNIAPSQDVAVVRSAGRAARQLCWHSWGLIPSWAKDPSIGNRLINARAETAAQKPAFRDALRRRRCLIPATGFYEWSRSAGKRGPVWFHSGSGGPIAFAGLWEHWSVADQAERWSCTILTTQANATVRSVHGRMPVVLAPVHHERWLDPAQDVAEELVALLSPCEESVLEALEVSTRVNDVSFDDAECIAPRPAPSLGPLFDSLR